MGFQYRVIISVNSVGSFFISFIYSNYYIIPNDVFSIRDTVVSMTKKKKKSHDFKNLMRIHERMGRKQDINNQFQW